MQRLCIIHSPFHLTGILSKFIPYTPARNVIGVKIAVMTVRINRIRSCFLDWMLCTTLYTLLLRLEQY